MAIDYLEIRASDTRDIIGVVDGAQSIIWHDVYYGCGDFEVYAAATQNNVSLLQIGNYVSKPFDNDIAIIERIEITNTVTDGKMIVASGRLAKSLLERRLIYSIAELEERYAVLPIKLQGNVEEAVRKVVSRQMITYPQSYRNMDFVELGALGNYDDIIVDENGNPTVKQVTAKNLLAYITSVLKEFGMSCKMVIDTDSLMLQYVVTKGKDRSADNTDGSEAIVFSIDYDNLIESNYIVDISSWKTVALIGGQGEGIQRWYQLINGTATGPERREIFFDDSSITKDSGSGTEYTAEEYNKMLISDGLQKLAALEPIEDFNGTLNVQGGIWKYGEDYNLGDIVTIQDNELGIYKNVRIAEVTETQDENGYNLDITYSSEGV